METHSTLSLMAIFLASLLGSVHCIGMCGGFVAAYASRSKGSILPHISYNFGRLTTYLALGVFSGFLGGAINKVGVFGGINRGAGLLTGLLLIGWGIGAAGNFSWYLKIRTKVTAKFTAPIHKIVQGIDDEAPWQGALVLGLCSTLLPCGWLYGYAAIAASSGSPLGGALIMFVFWLGTLPALGLFGILSAPILRIVGARAPLFSALLLVAAGSFSIMGHFDFFSSNHCHHAHHQM